MKTSYKLASVLSAVTLLAVTGVAIGQGANSRKIVVFDEAHFNGAYAETVIAKHSGVKVKDLDFVRGKVINISKKEASLLATEAGILSVEDDAVMFIQAKPGTGGGDPTVAAQILPWGVDKVDAELVWPSGNTADPIKVAVIDTGISNKHSDLKANIKGGYNAININRSWNDDNGHGSHVAGIIAGINNSQGVVGAAHQADLYAVKVLGANGSGFMSDVIEGIGWASSNGMNVVNMSLGCACNSQALHDAVINAKNAGVIIVAAAGNDQTQPVIYPAAYPEVIAVGATDKNNQIASWSSHGPEVDVSAPGVSIYSTYKGTGYATLSGTSMATPHVVGAIALLLNTPVGNYDELANGKWDFAEVRAKLSTSSVDLGLAGWDEYFGFGLVNALSLVTQ